METLLCVRLCAIVLFLLAVLFSGSSAQQQSRGVIYANCLRNATSLTTTFRSDLETTLRDFSSLSARGATYSTTTTTDSLYAMFQCRGDLSPASCSACMQNATALLPLACPLSVGARLRLDGCFLRYDNQSFFHLDTSLVVALCNAGTTTDSVALTAISDVMQDVIAEAPKSSQRSASAIANDIYGIAECWRYLNESECSQCLKAIPYRQFCDSSLGKTLNLASCDYRYENYRFLDSTSPSLQPSSSAMPPSSPSPQPRSSATTAPPPSGSKIWIAGVVLGVLGGVFAVCIVLWYLRRASKLKGGQRLENTSSSRNFFTKARLFSLEELEEATDHFNPTNKLGEGGFGAVYEGTLLNGDKVAIKTLHRGSERGKQEFLNEVNVITTVQHKNLIELLGCCVEGSKRILVYKYLANKSLDIFLSGRDARTLTWSNRFGIILGMAKGLAYLHEESQIPIIHRDIKPSNILLDDQLNPIIADFGLARLVQDDETHKITGVAGTIGYLSPEYVVHGALSQKVDVYSFGLVALEIVTGKHNMAGAILTLAWQTYEHGNALELVDPRMRGAFSPDQVVRVVHVALLCTQDNPKLRPLMSTIVLWLSGSSVILEIPIKPTFLNHYEAEAPVSGLNQPMISTPSTSSRSAVIVSGGALSVSGVDPR